MTVAVIVINLKKLINFQLPGVSRGSSKNQLCSFSTFDFMSPNNNYSYLTLAWFRITIIMILNHLLLRAFINEGAEGATVFPPHTYKLLVLRDLPHPQLGYLYLYFVRKPAKICNLLSCRHMVPLCKALNHLIDISDFQECGNSFDIRFFKIQSTLISIKGVSFFG